MKAKLSTSYAEWKKLVGPALENAKNDAAAAASVTADGSGDAAKPDEEAKPEPDAAAAE